MPDRFARCLNFDYCTLGDRRLVLRLAPGEPFFCPECAQALTTARAWRSGNRITWPAIGTAAMGAAAIAACVLVVQHWPQQIAALVPHWLAPTRVVLAPPSAVDIIRGTAPPDGMPDPGKLFLAATMDESMPSGAGSYILREHHRRPPRSDPAAVEAIAQLLAGVQGLPEPEHLTRATMPWRQAMIMAALLAPGQSLGPAGVPQLPVTAPDLPEPTPTPAAAIAPSAPPTAAPPPLTSSPPTRAAAPTPADIRTGPAAVRRPDRRAERRMFWRAYQSDAPLVAQAASLSMVVDDPPQPASGNNPDPTKPANPAAAVQPPKLAPPPITVTDVPDDAPPQAASPGAVKPSGQGAPPITVTDVPPDVAPPPAKRVVTVPSNANMSFGPMDDGTLNSEPIRPVFIPQRPAIAKPDQASMTLNCIIETSGVPTNCRVIRSKHASGLTDEMADFLSSGMVRRPPKVVDGRLVRSRQVIVLKFPAESQAPEPPP